jgi:MSHA biogenesis protein MshO
MAEYLAPYDHSQQPFIIEPATLQRNATVQVRLHFQRNNEDIVFNHEIQIKNVP